MVTLRTAVCFVAKIARCEAGAAARGDFGPPAAELLKGSLSGVLSGSSLFQWGEGSPRLASL